MEPKSAGPDNTGLPRHQSSAVDSHVKSLAEGLVRGLDELPSGPELATECGIRRSEVMEGIGQILHLVDATEYPLDIMGSKSISSAEWKCFSNRLEWATLMTEGLRQGVEALQGYDDVDIDSDLNEYFMIDALLDECDRRIGRLASMRMDTTVETALIRTESLKFGSCMLRAIKRSFDRVQMLTAGVMFLDDVVSDSIPGQAQKFLIYLSKVLCPMDPIAQRFLFKSTDFYGQQAASAA